MVALKLFELKTLFDLVNVAHVDVVDIVDPLNVAHVDLVDVYDPLNVVHVDVVELLVVVLMAVVRRGRSLTRIG